MVASQDSAKEMEAAAVGLTRWVGYWSAGTAEYLDDSYVMAHFLEVKPKLQVEHTCTLLRCCALLFGSLRPYLELHLERPMVKLEKIIGTERARVSYVGQIEGRKLNKFEDYKANSYEHSITSVIAQVSAQRFLAKTVNPDARLHCTNYTNTKD